ncbi:MAG: efflux RND transporter permease subunit [Prevotellaceae bacterium]|jgi:HAE1 family hydrophobic/amphiphilic exporter-1|nr:efflux RND transporter permease subunit [Prevotellaceae bacterium]
MKNIIKFAVGNPVTIWMIILAILLLGKISYDRLNVDLLPDLSSPRLFIELQVGERPPEEIEKLLIENLEALAIRQSDVVEVSSIIKAGSAQVTVEYTWGKDMDEAFLDLQKALSSISTNSYVTEMQITQHDPNTAPVMLVGMSHRTITDMAELRKVAESYIRNELIRLEGVAEVTLSGAEVTNLSIRTDPYKLDAFGLTIDDIASRIESNNQSISGGRVSEMGIQYLVKSTNRFGTVADFENLIVGYKPVVATTNTTTTTESAPIYLREVADVSFENAEPENIVRVNGERSIGLSIYKEMRYNTVRVVDEIAKQMKVIEQALPGYRFQVITNQGTFIKESINEVKSSAILGIVLAIFVLYLFLRRIGSTLIVSFAIPISIVATFNLMYFNGLTLNIMTLGGLALGAGMLVDNAIVVIESIFRNHRKGTSLTDVVVRGTSEVGGAIIASTLTTVVVFLPIVYLHGATGELFKDQAWTVTFSLVSSLFVAILVIPMLYKQFARSKNNKAGKTNDELGYLDTKAGKLDNKGADAELPAETSQDTLEASKEIRFAGYGELLHRVLQRPWRVVIAAVALLLIAACCLPFIGTEYIPSSNSQGFSLNIKLPEGTRLERTSEAVRSLETLVRDISGDSLCTIYSHIGPGTTASTSIFEAENTATMHVLLSDASTVSPAYVVEHLIETADNPGVLEMTVTQEEGSLSSLLGNEDAPVIVEIKGEDLDELKVLTRDVSDRMREVPGLYNVVTTTENGAPEIVISINRTLAGINNLSTSTVIQQLQAQLVGQTTGKMEYKGEMRDITVKLPDVTLSDLNGIIIRSGTQTFRLQEIATLEQAYAPKEIYRRNQNRISRIPADIATGYSLDKVAQDIREVVKDIELPTNYSITVSGAEEKRQESMHSLMLALLLSVVLVYMVLAAQFESLLHPFTILLTIPLALVGAVLLFFITGITVNIMGVIGIIMLAGIAVNNSIILVDRINQLKNNMPLVDAIVAAGQQRIRPIIMTTLTTILALLPLALSFGEGASLRSPMAIAVIGGLVTSTLMSLLVIPCVYYLLEKAKRKAIKG